jgi:hypothetical protein
MRDRIIKQTDAREVVYELNVNGPWMKERLIRLKSTNSVISE